VRASFFVRQASTEPKNLKGSDPFMGQMSRYVMGGSLYAAFSFVRQAWRVAP
jgi:hypothetical protein